MSANKQPVQVTYDAMRELKRAQAAIAASIQLADIADDPLRYPLEAISNALTVLYEGNRAVIEEAAARMESVVREGADRTCAALAQTEEASKRQAAKLINDAGAWSAEKLRTAAEEASERTVAQMQKAIDRAERAAVYAARVMMLTGGLVVVVAVMFVYLMLWVFPVR